jgi:adenylate cyclase class 2
VLEIEVKIRVDNLEEVRGKLVQAGAVLRNARYFEENTLYDLPDDTLVRKRCALRLRTCGRKAFLTYKGPPQKSRKFKVREEFETEVKNVRHTKRIFQALGYRSVFSYQKHRTVYHAKKMNICLDETAVGCFLELEGERSNIVRFARKLGYTKQDFITADYISMIKESGIR